MALLRRTSTLLAVAALATGASFAAVPTAFAASAVTTWDELVAAFAAGGDVQLGGNITASAGQYLEVPADGSVQLDLNGSSLTITNPGQGHAAIAVPTGSSFTLRDTNMATNTAVLTGGQYGAGIGGSQGSGGGDITIASGTVTATGGNLAAGIGGSNDGSREGTTIRITGGAVSATGGELGAGIGTGHAATATGGDIVIDGGTVTATGGTQAAGVGGGNENGSGDITISAGTVTATGGLRGPGIGAGNHGVRDGKDITISGGTVNATGGDRGAGIGGGRYASGGDITIEGGEVTATGSTNAAGIGGGESDAVTGVDSANRAADHILVTGGTVDATGGDNAAGIGGGNINGGGDVTIEDGDVTATGGSNGAGIGSGSDGDRSGNTVTIAGGTVDAVGGPGSAGIGGAHDGSTGTVTLTGGSIDATAGANATAIGGGNWGAGGTVSIGATASVTVTGERVFGRGGLSDDAWGSLSNAGSLTITSGSGLDLPAGVTVSNSGLLTNSGTISGTGTIDNTGRILGSGLIENGGFGGWAVLVSTNNYTLQFDLDGVGSGGTPGDLAVFAGTVADSTQTLPTPAASAGHVFGGWFTAATGGTRVTDTTDLGAALGGSGPRFATLYARQYIPQAITLREDVPTSVIVGGFYLPFATGGGSGQPVTLSVAPGTTNGACTIADNMVTAVHVGTCAFAVDQAGDDEYGAAPTVTGSFPVVAATTTTDVAVNMSTLTATVTPAGSATATGQVRFTVDGADVGGAALVNGTATLAHTVPTGATHTVTAVFQGNDDFTGSSGSVDRGDPTIVATVSPVTPTSGWYTGPVTVSFTCAPTTAILVPTTCPSPVRLTGSGPARPVTGSVLAADGGTATTTVTIRIDRKAPALKVTGVKKGATYTGKAPRPRCVGSDKVSGLASCKLVKKTKKVRGGTRVTYTATAIDKAGNRTVKKGTYTLKKRH